VQLIDEFINVIAELYSVDSKTFMKIYSFGYLSYRAVSTFIKCSITGIHSYNDSKMANLAVPYKCNVEYLNSLRPLRR
jgi:hypothetical protein